MKSRHFAMIVALLTTASATTLGSDVETTVRPEAPYRRIGLVLGLNEPAPALIGFNVGLNVTDFARITAGLGHFTSTVNVGGLDIDTESVSYAVGARFFVPRWNFTPVVGVTWGGIETEGFPDTLRHVYFTAGLQWTFRSGLSIGAGYHRSTDVEVGGRPYVNVGCYFGEW